MVEVEQRVVLILTSAATASAWPVLSWCLAPVSEPLAEAAGLLSATLFGMLVLAPLVPPVGRRTVRRVLLSLSAPVIFIAVVVAAIPLYSAFDSGRLAAAGAGALGVVLVAAACRWIGRIPVPMRAVALAALVGAALGAVDWTGFAFAANPEPGISGALLLWQPFVAACLFWQRDRAAA
jgi:hypothetical protein